MITPNGKQIDIVPKGSHYKIQFSSGGELPSSLSGLFTSRGEAETAVNVYLICKERSVKTRKSTKKQTTKTEA